MPAAGVRRIVLLTLGWEELPLSVSLHGASDEIFRCPVPGVMLQTDDGWVLLDTGFNAAIVRDPGMARRFFGNPDVYRAVLPGPGEPLEEALDAVGIDMGDITTVAVSHLHHDHAGGLKHFAARVPVHCQRRELEYGLSNHPEPERHAMNRIDYDDPAIDWVLADGEAQIAPGVLAVPTYGHTPGHQSFLVTLDESVGGGGFVFAFDAGDLTQNFDDEIPVGGRIGYTPEETLEPIRRLKAIAAEKDYRLIPGHDPHVWPALTQEFADRPW